MVFQHLDLQTRYLLTILIDMHEQLMALAEESGRNFPVSVGVIAILDDGEW
jgi:hypothetical protein